MSLFLCGLFFISFLGMEHALYWIASLTFAIILGIILCHAYVYRNESSAVDRAFRILLSWCVFFCLQDALWGVAAMPGLGHPEVLFWVTTGFHIWTVISAYIWLHFVLVYLGRDVKYKLFLRLLVLLAVGFQAGLVIRDIFVPTIFTIGPNNEYLVESLRRVAFFNQYFIYVLIGLVTVIAGLKNKGNQRKNYFAVFWFVLAPILCGVFQLFFPDAPFYSIGFVLGCSIIHVFIVSKEHNDNLIIASTTDELTRVFNRRAYEDDFKRYREHSIEEDLVLFSVDINGLKQVNDTQGHLAGDELIMGASRIIASVFAGCGKVYRVGGDEFIVAAHIDEPGDTYKTRLETEASQWKGQKVKDLSFSIGYAARRFMHKADLIEMKKAADKMMYQEKNNYYKSKGVDRRGQQEAFDAVCNSYTKILKIDLTSDSYGVIKMNLDERTSQMGFSSKISVWLQGFGTSGQVHEEDLDEYLTKTDFEYLREYFKMGNSSLSIFYRRRAAEGYNRVMMEMIPAEDYSNDSQTLYLYVKVVGSEHTVI